VLWKAETARRKQAEARIVELQAKIEQVREVAK
jgi:hypothetical protein